ncbi:MAG: hypothetical protein JMDDDDMK_04592 [Acidobacteria bacterium]|nr:hypothetical protein [Acidobacteriota bacterium]
MRFEIVGAITNLEVIAVGSGIRNLAYLRKRYGRGRWRKMKGIAKVKLLDGTIHTAEIHWYEAHGVGKRDFKIKPPLLD